MTDLTPDQLMRVVDSTAGMSWIMVLVIQKMDKAFGPMIGAVQEFEKEPKRILMQWRTFMGIVTVVFSYKLQDAPLSLGVPIPDLKTPDGVRVIPPHYLKVHEIVQEVNLLIGGDDAELPRVEPFDKGDGPSG